MFTRIIAPLAALAFLGVAADASTPQRAGAPSAPAYDVIVLAKLVERTARNAPMCGVLHVGEAMRYQVITVERGKLTDKTIWVIHGCPEMPRSMYGGIHAGTLQQFKLGDVHRLRLRRTPRGGAGTPSVFNPPAGIQAW